MELSITSANGSSICCNGEAYHSRMVCQTITHTVAAQRVMPGWQQVFFSEKALQLDWLIGELFSRSFIRKDDKGAHRGSGQADRRLPGQVRLPGWAAEAIETEWRIGRPAHKCRAGFARALAQAGWCWPASPLPWWPVPGSRMVRIHPASRRPANRVRYGPKRKCLIHDVP